MGISNEIGRSMTEILGVLAVIGVLSIGGIQGYTYAMNKYRTNNILNELNMSSNELAITLLSARTLSNTLNLGKPYDDGHILSADYTFEYGCSHLVGEAKSCMLNERGYWMTLFGVPKNICKHLLQSSDALAYLIKQYLNKKVVTNGVECLDGDNFLAFLFDVEGGSNLPDKMPAKLNCPTNTEEDGQGGLATILTDEFTGKSLYCYCQDVNTKYTAQGRCEPDPMKNCKTNYDCNKGQYCQITNWGSVYCTKNTSGMSGTCRSIAGDTKNRNQSAEKPPFIVSSVTMNWWSANHFCQAQGMKMVKISDYGCAHTICASNSCNGKNGYCHADKKVGVGTQDATNVADSMVKMYNAYDKMTALSWTDTHFNNCMSYSVSFSAGNVSYRRIDQKIHAVCMK